MMGECGTLSATTARSAIVLCPIQTVRRVHHIRQMSPGDAWKTLQLYATIPSCKLSHYSLSQYRSSYYELSYQ